MSDSITKVQGNLDFGNNGSIINTDLKNTSLESLTQSQIDSIVSPKTGLTVYNISTKKINVYEGTSWTDGAVLDDLTVKLLTNVYITTGTEPSYVVSIPNVTTLSQLVDKKITVKFHRAIPYGSNITLNVNGLGGINISSYNSSSVFKHSTRDGYIITLIYSNVSNVFTMVDVGENDPVTLRAIAQVINGAKSFTDQVEVTTPNGFGITNTNGYLYTKQDSRSRDAVGDIRIKNVGGYTISERCVVSSTASKGGGTWIVTDAPAPSLVLTKTGLTTQIASGSTLNLLSLFTISDGVPTNSLITDWSLVGGILKFPSLNRRVNYSIRISISGSFVGGSPSTNRTITLTFERADGTLIIGGNNSIVTSDTLTRTTQLTTPTFTDGVTDSFTTVGAVANLLQSSNQTLNITSVQVAIFGNRI